MAIRVGIDLVCANSVSESLQAHGARYLERVYSAGELADCSTASGVDPERLAACFAAKEATFKVLRVGDQAVSWHEVETQRTPAGWVRLTLSGTAATLARRAGVTALSVSLTYERGCAAAVVIAGIDEGADR